MVLNGDVYVDISSAAQGELSTTPITVTPLQQIKNDKALYQLDTHQFNSHQSKDCLFDMIASPYCVNGCKLGLKNVDTRPTFHWKRTRSFSCSHGRVHSQSSAQFKKGLISKINVSK